MYLKVALAPSVQIPVPAPGGPPAAASSVAASAPGLSGPARLRVPMLYHRRPGVGAVSTPLAPVTSPITLLPIGPAFSPVQPYPNSVTIQNLTTGNTQNFNAGDSWQITITGQPNSAVTVQTELNGAPQPVASYGNTDSNGQLVLSGVMPTSPGQWWQQWSVGGAVAGTISYNIGLPSVASPTSTVSSLATTTAAPATTSAVPAFLTDSFTVGTLSIPVWLPIGGGVALLFMSGGKKKRR